MEHDLGNILIIQSDPLTRDLMSLALTRAGYQVQAADDLRQALPLLREGSPNIILLDLFLQDSVGLDGLYYVRKEAKSASVQVIVVSALCFKEIVQVAVKAGVCDFLAKPVDPVDLLQRVQKAMARAHQLTDDAPIS